MTVDTDFQLPSPAFWDRLTCDMCGMPIHKKPYIKVQDGDKIIISYGCKDVSITKIYNFHFLDSTEEELEKEEKLRKMNGDYPDDWEEDDL